MSGLLGVLVLFTGGLGVLVLLVAVVSWLERPEIKRWRAEAPSYRIVNDLYDWAERDPLEHQDTREERYGDR